MVFAEGHANHSASQIIYETHTGALPMPVNFFQENTHDTGLILFTYKQLTRERAKLASGVIAGPARWAFASLSMREPDR